MSAWTSNPVRARFSIEVLFCCLSAGFVGACTLDTGEDFQVAEVVYDDAFFYCQVEPMLFEQGCGAGDAAEGDSRQGCHFNRQGLRLTDYSPLVSEQCVDNQLSSATPSAAQSNYQSAQLQMDLDPERAPLLRRPTSSAAHPRVVIQPDSPEADLIRAWATRYSSQ